MQRVASEKVGEIKEHEKIPRVVHRLRFPLSLSLPLSTFLLRASGRNFLPD